MDDKLRFHLKLLPHPYPEHSASRLEAWGHLTRPSVMPDSQLTLLEWEWNLDQLAEWFAEHQHDMCHGMLPERCSPDPDESIAHVLRRCPEFRETVDDEERDDDELFRWHET